MIKLKSLLNEMSQAQKELKKDYLFKQSLIPSSNKIPGWDVVWKSLKNSDGYNNLVDIYSDKFDEDKIKDMIEQDEYNRYLDVISTYEELDGDLCWRAMNLKRGVDPTKIQQLGIFWAIEEKKAAAHWGSGQGLKVVYKAKIDLKNVDWPGTIFARMDMSLGEEEAEIRFIKYSKIFVYDVSVIDRSKHDYYSNYPIKDWRRV